MLKSTKVDTKTLLSTKMLCLIFQLFTLIASVILGKSESKKIQLLEEKNRQLEMRLDASENARELSHLDLQNLEREIYRLKEPFHPTARLLDSPYHGMLHVIGYNT